MNREPIHPDDPLLTTYALGELPQREMAEFEALLERSPGARRELAERRELMSQLYEGFQREWHGHRAAGGGLFSAIRPVATVPLAGEGPIEAEDSPLTRYALGELEGNEATGLERRLHSESAVRAELEETREIMALLREGLRNEWKEQLEGPSEPAPVESVIVPVDFAATATREEADSSNARRARRKSATGLAVAAAAAIFLGVGALLVDGDPGPRGASSAEWGMADAGDMDNSLDQPEGAARTPRLFLAEEVADIESLAGEGGSSLFDGRNFPVDASYLQDGKLIQASYRESHPASGLPGENNPAWFRVPAERVDSYFPTSLEQDFQSGHYRSELPSGLRFSGKSV